MCFRFARNLVAQGQSRGTRNKITHGPCHSLYEPFNLHSTAVVCTETEVAADQPFLMQDVAKQLQIQRREQRCPRQ